MKSKTILFIHGMYMNSLCWEQWKKYFESKGYSCVALDWPGRNHAIDKLRKQATELKLGQLTLNQVVEHYAKHIKTLKEKPIIIGHSMGALVVQLLLQQDLAEAGIAISSAPPNGLLSTKWSFLKSNLPHINPFVSLDKPLEMTFKRFQYTFVNTLSLSEQKAAFERYVVPESRRVPKGSLTTKINFKQAHQPLLFVAGGADNLIPASLNKTNYKKYKNNNSIKDYKEFIGRTHFIIGQKNWEEIAEYIVSWIKDK